MQDYYTMATLVENYLEELKVHPVTVTEAISDENYEKSYQIRKENPTISKKEFLKKLGIEEYRQ